MSEKKVRNIDVVFALDATASMGVFIDRFRREFLPKLTGVLSEYFEKTEDVAEKLRYKFIIFRDYGSDGADAMRESRFYRVPEEMEALRHDMLFVEAGGGGDSPENGLEALYYAMKTDFTGGENSLQMIVLFTDADAVPLRARADCAGYPADMPDEEGLAALWRDKNAAFSQEGKRLIVFAPQGTAYEKLAEKLDNSRIFYTVKSGNLNDIDLVDFACRSKNLL